MLSFEHKKSVFNSFKELQEKLISNNRIDYVYPNSLQRGKILATQLHPSGNGYVIGKYMDAEIIRKKGYKVDERGWINIKDFTREQLKEVISTAMTSMTGKNKKYYWLNVDASGYEWAFFILKIGTSQTYSNLNPDGNKRKNPRCFQEIKVGDLVFAYETGDVRAITTLCRVVDKYEEDDEIFVNFKKIEDYENILELETLKGLEKLDDCGAVHFHRGTLFEIEKRHYELIVETLERLNPVVDINEKLYVEVKQAIDDGNKKREERLNGRNSIYPDTYEIKTKAFKRNADVIAQVLIRAQGICEKCRKEAPFKRASDGTPYLEVHHMIRLADGGEDTVENAIAVCPNCHRELHFG